MVHWCPHLRTVISDIEIEYEDLTESGPQTLRLPNHQDVEFGYIHHFEYEIQNSSKRIQVATTRLETMLGDVAIAVHPEDPRWCSEIGQFATHPFRPGHLMPIVADGTLVDMSTGTGAVKLTPAHDPNDFEAAKRHDLPVRSILDLNARITDEAGSRYAGRDRFEVREMLENDLSGLGLYVIWCSVFENITLLTSPYRITHSNIPGTKARKDTKCVSGDAPDQVMCSSQCFYRNGSFERRIWPKIRYVTSQPVVR